MFAASNPLLSLSAAKVLTPSFHPMLPSLLKTHRQLLELNFKKQISNSIVVLLQNFAPFYESSLTLRRLCSFYNQIEKGLQDYRRGVLDSEIKQFELMLKGVRGGQLEGVEQGVRALAQQKQDCDQTELKIVKSFQLLWESNRPRSFNVPN